jgi:hypothetical protein
MNITVFNGHDARNWRTNENECGLGALANPSDAPLGKMWENAQLVRLCGTGMTYMSSAAYLRTAKAAGWK